MAESNLTILAVPPQPIQTANDEIIERFVAYLGTEKGLALRARLLRGRFEGHCNRIITYLTDQQSKAETLDEQDHYNFCRRVVSLALEGWPDPYVAAFYYHYGRHPNKLIPEFLWRAEKNRRLNIPDYDPLSDPLCKVRSFPSRSGPMYQMPVSSWPVQQDSLRNSQEEERDGEPRISHTRAADLARANALDTQQKPVLPPFRRILDRIPTVDDGHLVYYTEQLECGHSHIEFPGGNPGKKRRCQSCALSGPLCPVVSTAFLRSCSGLGRLSCRTDNGVSLSRKGNRRAMLRNVPRPPISCAQCGASFTPVRKDVRYCSVRCRGRAWTILRRFRGLESSKVGRCARCMMPLADKSGRYCQYHLRLAREEVKRCRMRKRLARSAHLSCQSAA